MKSGVFLVAFCARLKTYGALFGDKNHKAFSRFCLCGHEKSGLNALAIDQQKSRVMKILLHRCEFTDELIAAEARHNFLIIQLIDQCEQIFASNIEILQQGVTPRMAAISIHTDLDRT